MKRYRRQGSRQQGAVAIEFAFVLPIFIGLFYAIVSYAMVFLLMQSFTYTAEDALRAALRADCSGEEVGSCENLETEVNAQISDSLHWLPGNTRQAVQDSAEFSCDGETCTLRLGISNYPANAVLPPVNLPFIGQVPRLPQDLMASASLRM